MGARSAAYRHKCAILLTRMSPTIFIGGVHGAGKTTFSKELVRLLGASHVTAGGLIRESASSSARVTVGIGDKAVPDVDANQLLLLRGLGVFRARIGPSPVLLDGHFVLLDATGAIAEIPLAVYEVIAPCAVLLVEADAGTIRRRLLERDGEAPTSATLAELMVRERAHAEHVCAALGLPLWSIAGAVAVDREAVVPIYPAYHTELLPDSILKTEDPDDFEDNKPNRNALSKVYISRSYERGLNPGDIVVFYRTKSDDGPAWYTSVATSIGVVQEVVDGIPDLKTFLAACRKRSVFTDAELQKHWDWSPRSRPFVVNFLFVYSLPKRPNLKALDEIGFVKSAAVLTCPVSWAHSSLENGARLGLP
jgi:adenylate kinase